MRIENVFCEVCGIAHYVQVVRRDPKGRIIETKCLGNDFLPIQSKLSESEPSYIKHSLRGYDIIKKAKREPKKRMVTTFKREPLVVQPIAPINRACIAALSLSVQGQFVTIKVFEDATPEKFYEFYYDVSNKPKMIKPRTLGRNEAVHISDIPNIYKIEGKVNLTFHNREQYEKLLKVDPNSMAVILDKNMRVSSERR